MLIVPAVDIMGGKVVRLAKGDFNDVTTYELSPLVYAQMWEAQGAQFIHVVDLDGARSGEPKNLAVIRDIVKGVRSKIAVGGGIRSVDVIRRYLEIGIERVVLSTKVIEDASFLLTRDIKDYLKKVSVSVDIKQMESLESATATTGGWLATGDVLIDVPSFIQTVSSAGVGYLNFSDITKDGTLEGPDTKKILNFVKVARAAAKNKLFLTYAGGISSLDDLKNLNALGEKGVDAVIVGKALYENRFTLEEAISITKVR